MEQPMKGTTFATVVAAVSLWLLLITTTVNNNISFFDYDFSHVSFVTYIRRRLDALHPRRPETESAFFQLNHHERTDSIENMESKIRVIKERRQWAPWNESNAYVQDILSFNPSSPNRNNIFKKQAPSIRKEGATTAATAAPPKARMPNILLILADDLGYGDLGVEPFVAANPQEAQSKFPCVEGAILTPNLLNMAARGTIMVNFHSASPVCSPSRVAIMTGLYPWRLNALNAFELGRELSQRNGFLPQVPTGAEIFREAGYYTIHSGKWHIGGMREEMRVDRANKDVCVYGSPNQHGFEEYTSALDGPESPRYTFLNRNSELHSKGHRHRIKDDVPYPYVCGQNCAKPNKDIEVLSDVEALDALDIIRRLTRESPHQPWYSQIWFNAPHGPWEIVPSGVEPYNKKYKKTTDAWKSKCKEGNQEFVPWDAQYFKYKTMVTAMDASIGIVLDTIRELGIENHTLIVFTSDNGAEMGAGTGGVYKQGKRSLMEGGVRVPAFFQWVGKIPANKVSSVFGGTVDLVPTFLDAAGLVKPKSIKMDGISILSALVGRVSDMKVHRHRNTNTSDGNGRPIDESSLMNLMHSGVESITSNIKKIERTITNATNHLSSLVSTIADKAVPNTPFPQAVTLQDLIAADLIAASSSSKGKKSGRRLQGSGTGAVRRSGGFREDEMRIKTRVFLWHKDTDPFSRDQRVQSAGYYEELKVITSSFGRRHGCVDRIFDLRHDPLESRNLVAGPNSGDSCKTHLENFSPESLALLVDKTAAKTHCNSGPDQEACMAKYHTTIVSKALHILERLKPFVLHGSVEHGKYMSLDRNKATCSVPVASSVRKLRFSADADMCIRFANCSSPEY